MAFMDVKPAAFMIGKHALIAEHHYHRSIRNDRLELPHQRAMHVLRRMAFLPVTTVHSNGIARLW